MSSHFDMYLSKKFACFKQYKCVTRQNEVLELIVANPKITIPQIADKLEINKSAAQGHIDALKTKEVIERKGGTRGFWLVKGSKD